MDSNTQTSQIENCRYDIQLDAQYTSVHRDIKRETHSTSKTYVFQNLKEMFLKTA